MPDQENPTDSEIQKKQAGFFSEIRHYVISNLLSVLWSASLFLGGVIFWFHYSRIQYFPDLNLDESVLFLAVAAFTGAFLITGMALLSFFPYYFRGVFLDKGNSFPSRWDKDGAAYSHREPSWYFFSILLVQVSFLFYFFLDSRWKCAWLSWGAPMLILTILIGVHYWVYLSRQRAQQNRFDGCDLRKMSVSNDSEKEEKVLEFQSAFESKKKCTVLIVNSKITPNEWMIAGVNDEGLFEAKPLDDLTSELAIELKKKPANETNIIKLAVSYLGLTEIDYRAIAAWTLSAGAAIFPFLLVIPLADKTPFQDDMSKFLIVIGCLVIILFGNTIFASFRENEEKRWWYWAIPFGVVFFVLVFARTPFVPEIVMRLFKFGDVTVNQLVLDKTGCEILNRVGLNFNYANNTCSLEEIKILSRLGRSFYLEATGENYRLRFTIPSAHVLSWTESECDRQKRDRNQSNAKCE